jgi:hypothetical protein
MRFYLVLPLLALFTHFAMGQCRTFKLSSKGDTLNCTDMTGLKQGKWKIHVDPLRGEPGYEDEGAFINNKREGVWRRFNLMGDLVAIENYRWGYKNGVCRYFTIAGLEHEENWLAVNPAKAYDTIDVQDLQNPDKYEKVVVKIEGHSLRHGTWRYYFPPTGQILRTERYMLDQPYNPETAILKKDSTNAKSLADTSGAVKSKTTSDKNKPKEVLEFEKKNAGKKIKVRDGRTG